MSTWDFSGPGSGGAVSAPPREAPAGSVFCPQPAAWLTGRLADYVEMTKPKIAVLALVTVTVGYALGSAGVVALEPLCHALFGITLVAVASGVLNQYVERHTDARMPRTNRRPLPAGRVHPTEAVVVGLAAGIIGCGYLLVSVNALTAGLAGATLLLYVAAYTPLKRFSSFCTAVGAVPGALPPVLGWTAAGGHLDAGAAALFAVLFLWQFPHFLAIGWLYQTEYERAGLKMLPRLWSKRQLVGGLSVVYALALIPASLLPSVVGLAGRAYFMAAVVLGLGYLFCAVLFMLRESRPSARRLLWSSLIYLPLLLLILTWDHFQLLR